MDISKNLYDVEPYFFKMKVYYKLSWVKIVMLYWLIRMSAFIWNVAHFTVQNSENVVKSRYFEKPLQRRNEEGT